MRYVVFFRMFTMFPVLYMLFQSLAIPLRERESVSFPLKMVRAS